MSSCKTCGRRQFLGFCPFVWKCAGFLVAVLLAVRLAAQDRTPPPAGDAALPNIEIRWRWESSGPSRARWDLWNGKKVRMSLWRDNVKIIEVERACCPAGGIELQTILTQVQVRDHNLRARVEVVGMLGEWRENAIPTMPTGYLGTSEGLTAKAVDIK